MAGDRVRVVVAGAGEQEIDSGALCVWGSPPEAPGVARFELWAHGVGRSVRMGGWSSAMVGAVGEHRGRTVYLAPPGVNEAIERAWRDGWFREPTQVPHGGEWRRAHVESWDDEARRLRVDLARAEVLAAAWERLYRARDAYHHHSMTEEWNAYEAAHRGLVEAGGPDLRAEEAG